MTTVVEKEALDYGPPRISWGAVIAGLIFAVAFSWLMVLLGSAIGFSIADATDLGAMDDGLSIGTIIWMLLTTIIACFLGGLLAGRLAGKPDKAVGMFHGITVWSGTTIVLIILGYLGVANLIQGGQALLQGATAAVGTAASTVATGVASGVTSIGSMGAEVAGSVPANNTLVNTIQAQLKRRASEVVAQMDAAGGPDVTEQEVQQTIEQMDSQTLQQVAVQLIQGDTEAAKNTLRANSELSSQEIDNLIDGIAQEVAQQLGISPTPDDTTALVNQVQQRLTNQVSSLIASADAAGGADVTQQEVSQALQQLDVQTLQNVAFQLVQGNTEAAKDTLVVNTDLSEQEINSLVDGIANEIEEPIQQFQSQVNETVETVSDYTQAVLWTAFISSAIGLLVAIAGGWVGADTVRRLYVPHRRTAAASY
jgi:hypothetical protein